MNGIVAIVGRPNVGKSTLFNRLIEKKDAIVDAESGVTRDRNYGKCDWNGKEFSIIDTGGYLVGGDDIFEKQIDKQVELAIDETALQRGGYDNEFEAYDDVVYDLTLTTPSKSVNYDFIVRVTDGVSSVTRNFNIFVYSADFWIVSNSNITIDQTQIGTSYVTLDLQVGRPPVFTTEPDLGTFRHDNQAVIRIDVSDFDPLQADLTYSISRGSLPPGLSIDSATGEISGQLGRQSAISVDYTCLLYTSPSPRDRQKSRMPSSS